MEPLNTQKFNRVKVTEAILQSDIGIITIETLRNLLGISRHQTPFDLINSLVTNGILKRLEMGKYIIPSKNPSKFLIEITSATVKKTKNKEIDGNVYGYSHINKELFWGYEKKDGFLIAFPEKALLDQIYLSINGKKQIDISEYDLSGIDKKRLNEYIGNIKTGKVKERIIEILKTNKIL